MTYCLGHPAIVASIGPVIPSANLCKVLYNFVDICIRKQNFAELTPVHLCRNKYLELVSAIKVCPDLTKFV